VLCSIGIQNRVKALSMGMGTIVPLPPGLIVDLTSLAYRRIRSGMGYPDQVP
jgi:hypothetical protein